ncbi:hypothetical protein AIOL_000751 [Candidatus Rhodobacter oscarellae]|uniref:Uncharacterized protein n=1 Tax=Candidatus Rhodobacter oscarellae TaxID=1675527 RepID=A0A0J9EFW6_9RHOB|nr:hypothetical protein [Candidatus Rhodobacter lobularis]KMW60589.1 hypothetical protein AIOL_000751 [Candidatus Rhodobacter lobularis]
MAVSRRSFLRFGLVAGVGAAGAWIWSRSIEAELRSILRRNFASRIADAEGSTAFIDDFARLWRGRTSLHNQSYRPRFWATAVWSQKAQREREAFEANVLAHYLRATNVIRADETDQDLIYLGMPNPYESPCSNPISSEWL